MIFYRDSLCSLKKYYDNILSKTTILILTFLRGRGLKYNNVGFGIIMEKALPAMLTTLFHKIFMRPINYQPS